MNVYCVWNDYFGNLPPRGHLMREPLLVRWLRIHSLPESKRYADNDQEYSELLERHHRVSCEILGVDQDSILFASIWGDSDGAPPLSKFEWAARAGLANAKPVEFPHPEEDEPPILVVGCPIRWSARGRPSPW